MDTMPLITLLLVAFPEGMLLAAVGLTLIGIKPQLKTTIYLSLLFAISAFFARKLPLPMGAHSIIILILFSIHIFLVCNISYKKALIAAFLSFLFVVAAEILFMPLIISVFPVTLEMILSDPWLRILVAIPQKLFMLIIFIISYRARGFHRSPAFLEASR